jgi:hypothetical protein
MSLLGFGAFVGRGALGAGSFGLGTTIGRTALGAGVGAAYAGATSPYDSRNLTFSRVFEGAVLGAVGGLGLSGVVHAGTYAGKKAYRQAIAAGKDPSGTLLKIGTGTAGALDQIGYSLGRTANVAWSAGGVSKSVAAFGLDQLTKHPLGIIGGTAAIAASYPIFKAFEGQQWNYGSSVMNGGGGDLSNASMVLAASQEQQALEALTFGSIMPTGGISSSRAQLMGSTAGLVQGLHRNRHR